MDEIKTKWGELKFIVNSYREAKATSLLSVFSDEEIDSKTLDDHQLKIQSMMGSRYVAEIR